MSKRERDNDRFPLEFKEKESMKVTSTIEKCIFVPMAEEKSVNVNSNWLLTHQDKHILLGNFFFFF